MMFLSTILVLRKTAFSALILAVLFPAVPICSAAELKPETVRAFDRYVQLTEARMHSEVQTSFLYLDSLPAAQKEEQYRQLHNGGLYIEPIRTTDKGKSIAIPGGMIHHWIGVIFVPGANLKETLAIAQNYDNREQIYKPDVTRSKLISHNGDDFKVFLRLYKKRFTTIVLNTDYDIHYHTIDANHVYCDSYTTRIAEVADPDKPDGAELPVGNDHGYLWRMYTYWRFEQKDGGVYMQIEAISLTRGIPYGLEWLLGPLAKSIPRESFSAVLQQTKQAILAEIKG